MAIIAIFTGGSIVPATSSHVIKLLVVGLSGMVGPSGSSAGPYGNKLTCTKEFPVWAALYVGNNKVHRSIHTVLTPF